jgi:hypothetical protein
LVELGSEETEKLRMRISTLHQGRKGREGGTTTERWLANRLRRFGIASQTMRVEDRQAKGYALADFREAFAKYLG